MTQKIKNSGQQAKVLAGVFTIGIIAIIGSTYLIFSRAAVPTASTEPENGSLSANVSVDTSDTTHTSGGAAIKFGTSAVTSPANTALPFTMPSTSTLEASQYKVFAHYMQTYALTIDNKAANAEGCTGDYYNSGFLCPSGENNKWLAVGGMWRERPLVAPIGNASTYLVDNAKTEVKRAVAAGIDGFAVDYMFSNSIDANYTRTVALAKAVQAVNTETGSNFKLMLVPDPNAGQVKYGDATGMNNLAASVGGLVNAYKSAFYFYNNKLAVAPYLPSGGSLANWTVFVNTMKNTYGLDTGLIPMPNGFPTNQNINQYKSLSIGYAGWGNGVPAANTVANYTANKNYATADGLFYMETARVQDERPKSAVYSEAHNSENLRTSWNSIITVKPLMVQLVTWNDYGENSDISPSTNIGWSLLNMTSYYLTWYKTGQQPAINKDVLYLSHRVHKSTAVPSNQTSYMKTPGNDDIEVAAFLKQPATVTIKNGSTVLKACSLPAGVQTCLTPLPASATAGALSANAVPTGSTIATATVTSPFPVNSTIQYQDMEYHFVSSAYTDGIGNFAGNNYK